MRKGGQHLPAVHGDVFLFVAAGRRSPDTDGGPAGLDTLASSIDEQADTLEEVSEPYLLQLGFIQRTPRGRVVTELGYRHLKGGF